jgi:hypothetical protein
MTINVLVIAQAAGESACRPGSVRPLARAGGHPSRTAVAGSLVRSTREHRAGRPQTLAQDPRALARIPLLTLLRVGFTKPLGSPRALVVSYTTVSPLPPAGAGGGLFSVALSRGSPRVGVTDHPALRSPDLPRHARRTWRDAAARPTRPPLPSSVGGRARPWRMRRRRQPGSEPPRIRRRRTAPPACGERRPPWREQLVSG